MAVRKAILCLGQSNGGAQASYDDWAALNPGFAVDLTALSSNLAQGSYHDRFVMPGTFPDFETVSLKGRAVQAVRYLTFFNPVAHSVTNAACYPGTMRVVSYGPIAGLSETGVAFTLSWQYTPVGQVLTRKLTGTQHTITAWFAIAPEYALLDPPVPEPIVGEEFEFIIKPGVNSPSASIIRPTTLFGSTSYDSVDWLASMQGCQIRCTTGSGSNDGEVRIIDTVVIDGGTLSTLGQGVVQITTTEPWLASPTTADTFVIEPPYHVDDSAVDWHEWTYWLPWSPFEGQATEAGISITGASSVTAGEVILACTNTTISAGDTVKVAGTTNYNGVYLVVAANGSGFTIYDTFVSNQTGTVYRYGKSNPYPYGFNYPNHIDVPFLYQPFRGPTFAYGPSAEYEAPVAAYHLTLAGRMNGAVGETIYVAGVNIDGATLSHSELFAAAEGGFAWFDPKQQNHFAPGEPNGCYARVMTVLDSMVRAAEVQGDTIELLGVFFIQGETDAANVYAAERYADNLRKFKSLVREAIVTAGMWTGSASTIPWVSAEVSDDDVWPYADTVNAAIAEVAADDTYMRVVSSTGLTKIVGDDYHYDAEGITELGNRCFEAWQQVLDGVGPAGHEDALVAEDGTGLTTSNSYATQAFADTYFANAGGVTAWTSATSQQKDTALRQATLWLDNVYANRFVGYKDDSTQALEFPRALAWDRDGVAIEGVPTVLKQATCEMARRWLEDSTQLDPDTAAGANVAASSVSVGPITVSDSFAGEQTTRKKFPVVDRLLQRGGLVQSGGWAQR